MTTFDITLPRLHTRQVEIKSNSSRFNVASCGRRFGKSTLSLDIIYHEILNGRFLALASLTYQNMLNAWRDIRHTLAPLITGDNKAERRINFVTGGYVDFWTDGNIESARGNKYHLAVFDEAAKFTNLLDKWQSVVRPTLADYKGGAWFFSTPRGLNDFWKLYQLAQDGEGWSSFQFSTYDNPFIDTSEIEAMRDSLPERIYQQEILAQFLDGGAGVFRGVRDAIRAEWEDEPTTAVSGSYVFGVDWGQSNDFTVITVIRDDGHVVHVDRFNQIDYGLQVGRLEALYNKFLPSLIVTEVNSMGAPVADALQAKGLPIEPFTTTNASKEQAIRQLSLAFENGNIAIPEYEPLISELLSYEMSMTRTGTRYRYSAPDGMHDDCVMSLAIGWQAVEGSKNVWGIW